MATKSKSRCRWVGDTEAYLAYHDKEWGVPVHDDQTLFECLTLEGAQAGLSWITVLNKRENYRKAFVNFDIDKVARFTPARVEKLMLNEGIVRNRLKIESTISNAKAFKAVAKSHGSFNDWIWAYVDHKPIQAKQKKGTPDVAQTDLSKTISKDLKKLGFRFCGPTIVYAYMQAIGMVNDHSVDCFRHKPVSKMK